MTARKPTNPKDRLIVALDFPTIHEAYRMAIRLGGDVGLFKVGKQLIHASGPDAIAALLGADLFYDCKLHDIPNTVEKAACAIAKKGFAMLNVHCMGGKKMMQAAVAGARIGAGLVGLETPLVIGVTALTSMDEAGLVEIGYPHGTSPGQLVSVLASLAQDAGLDGVVASPLEIAAIRRVCGPDFLIVTPGIRAADAPPDDQKRTMSAAEAVAAGADYIVVGRPITAAADPVEAAKQMVGQIAAVAA